MFEFKALVDCVKSYEEDGGKQILEGFASTSDFDFQGDIITQQAFKESEDDLLECSTVLHNHDPNESIGRVLEADARKEGLWIKILISKTVPKIWQKIQEGVLSKFSIKGKVIDATKRWSKDLKRYVNMIKRMKLVEVSLVAVPANPKAQALRWYISKAMSDYEKSGGEIPMAEDIGELFDDSETGLPDIVGDGDNVKKSDGGVLPLSEKIKRLVDDFERARGEFESGMSKAGSEALAQIVEMLGKLMGQVEDEALMTALKKIKEVAIQAMGAKDPSPGKYPHPHPYPYPQPAQRSAEKRGEGIEEDQVSEKSDKEKKTKEEEEEMKAKAKAKEEEEEQLKAKAKKEEEEEEEKAKAKKAKEEEDEKAKARKKEDEDEEKAKAEAGDVAASLKEIKSMISGLESKVDDINGRVSKIENRKGIAKAVGESDGSETVKKSESLWGGSVLGNL